MKKFYILFILGVVFSCSLKSQTPQWLNYTNGSTIYALAAEGSYIWAGTTGGLVKIDTLTGGTIFYNKINSGLPGNSVYSIAIDEQGTKWFGISGGGVAKFDNTNWTVYNSSNSGLPDNDVLSISIDSQGNKWFGTLYGGVAKFNNFNWTVYNSSNSGLPDNDVLSISIDSQGNKWFGTLYGGVAKFDNTNWTVYNSSNSGLPANIVHSIAIDAQGNKWFGTNGGAAKFDNINWTVYNSSNSGLPYNSVSSIAIDELGNKWFGTYGSGVAKFDDTNWTVYNSSNSGLPAFYVYSIVIDAQGNKWFGTLYSGVAKFDNANWTVYNSSNSGLPSNYFNSITLDAQGNKWFGTDAGLAKFDNVNWTVYNTFNSGLPDNDVLSISIDSQGNKWFGTGYGVAKFDNANWTVYNSANSGLPGNIICSIAIDAQGNKWFGTQYGVAKFDNLNWTVYNSANSGLPGNTIYSIAIDALGNKWFGTYYGVAKFDNANWTVYKSSNSGLPNNNVLSIAIDSQGNKWFGTDGGVAKFDNFNWTVYNSANSGLPGVHVYSIAIDAQGNKWFGTYGGGVAKFDNANWTVYNSSNSGLPDNDVHSIAMDVQGNKWFGTNDGGIGVYNENGIILGEFAQNWKPIVIDQKMNYRHSDSTEITNTIWVDSVNNNCSETIYFLNRIVADVPDNNQFVLRDHPLFYSAYFTEQANGIWATTQYTLKTLNGLDSSWLFDPSNNIIATIIGIKTEEIFGVYDSVKVISLSNGNVVKLSKNFGIIQFPDFVSGGYYELVGLQDTLGESVPDFWDIYNFEVGDVFEYHDYSMDPFGWGYIKRKITITSKQINANGYSYDYSGIYYINYFENGGGGGTDSYTYNDSFTFTNSLGHPANLFPLQPLLLENSNSGIGTGRVFCRAKIVFEPEMNSIEKEFGIKDLTCQPPYDIFYELSEASDTLYRMETTPCGQFGLGFGNAIGTAFSNDECFEYAEDSKLVGYIKNGDTVGLITPDTLLLTGLKNRYNPDAGIKIYPNPARDFVNFSFPKDYPEKSCVIELSAPTGEIVLTRQANTGIDFTLNTGDLNPGIYFYAVKSDQRIIQRGKIIIR